MRRLAYVLVLLAACDLQPAKHDAAARPAATVDAGLAPTPRPLTPVTVDAGVAVATDAPGAMRSVDAMQTTDACTDTAVHIADIVIASIQDPTIKAQQEQDRTRLIRRVAETCTRDKWPDSALKCFMDGKTPPELEVCGRNLAPPSP